MRSIRGFGWGVGGGFVFAIASLLLTVGLAAQEEVAGCGCAALFEALTTKVEANYPGYHLEVRSTAKEDAYRRHREAMRLDSERAAPGLECVAVLQAFVAWFEDGHLFVGGRPRIETAADSAGLREATPRLSWTESDVLRYLAESSRELDPVEGIWLDPAGVKLGVVRRDMGARTGGVEPERFVAFVIESAARPWAPGDVRAELAALPDGSYDAVLYDDARAATRPHVHTRGMAGGARLQRDGLLLHMPPTTWGKTYPVEPGLEGLIDAADPRAPTARGVGDDVVVFHVPSNVPAHAQRLRALVEQYRGALARAETLIIDLRGNEGGSTFVTDVFMPWLTTREKRPPRYLAEWSAAVLASDDNVAYFERASWAPAGLVGRLLAAEPGALVPFADPAADDATVAATDPAADEERPAPRNVAILTDAMTVSAAEAFVLKAMRNGKVTLFGEPTGSSIDYQTVGIVSFGCPDAGLYVGYPTVVGSDRLPAGGVRPTGIMPDVPIDPAAGDPIEQIVEYYARTQEAS